MVKRTPIVLLAGAMAVAVLVACEPLPPPATFTVTTTVDGLDANPGDGICEVTPGAGDCSLRAAFAEANAVPRGVIVAPGKTFDLTVSDPTDGDVDLDVVGHIDLSPASGSIHLRRATPGGALVDVAEDGWLLAKLALPSTDADTLLRVAGTLLLDDSLISVLLLGAGPNPVLHVLPTGTVVLLNSVVAGSATPAAIVNEGVLVARYSELIGFYAPAVHTATTGRTLVGASRVSSRDVYLVHDFEVPAVPACSGQFLESDGYNRVPNDSCALAEPTDLQSASSTWVDQIPPGTLGCGDFVVRDLNGQPRPADGDGDGISACDIGAKEWQPNP